MDNDNAPVLLHLTTHQTMYFLAIIIDQAQIEGAKIFVETIAKTQGKSGYFHSNHPEINHAYPSYLYFLSMCTKHTLLLPEFIGLTVKSGLPE